MRRPISASSGDAKITVQVTHCFLSRHIFCHILTTIQSLSMSFSLLIKYSFIFQIEVDQSIFDKTAVPIAFHAQKKSVFSLRDFIAQLRTNINRDELVYLHNQLSSELSERTSIIGEMIPGKTEHKIRFLCISKFCSYFSFF